jgi:recombination protein RecT
MSQMSLVQYKGFVGRVVNEQLASFLKTKDARERMVRVLAAAASANSKILECDQRSIAMAVLKTVQLGLEVSTPLGHAYLVPRRNRGQQECNLEIGYKGYALLGWRSAMYEWMDARVVYESDDFHVSFGSDRRLHHEPRPGERTDAKIVAAYFVASIKGGGVMFEVVTRDEINAARANSQGASSNYSPWSKHFAAMARKTAIRRAFQGGLFPMSTELAEALTADGGVIDGEYEAQDASPSLAALADHGEPSDAAEPQRAVHAERGEE